MIKHILTAFALLPLAVSAQSLVPEHSTVDLGQIRWENPTSTRYTLRNKSNTPLTIQEVDPGCGCITVSYPKAPINPGGTAVITVSYDAILLGHFQRYILVTDNTSNTPTELILRGNVVMEPDNSVSAGPVSLGSLMADNNYIEFDNVNKGDVMMREIRITNKNSQYVEPVILHLPSYLTAEVIPARIAPMKSAVVKFTLDSKKLHNYGLNQSEIFIVSDRKEKVSRENALSVAAVLLPEQVASDDPRIKSGPHLELSTTQIDLSQLNGKKKKKATVELKNTGRAELEISSLQMFTMGLQVTLPKKKLAPGESTKLKIAGDVEKLQTVRARPRILMITNDVQNQKVVIDINK